MSTTGPAGVPVKKADNRDLSTAEPRPCSTCQACCTTMAVNELEKKAGERCQHLTEHGCGIYETRPEECRRYFCLWADPNAQALDLPDWARPDRTGVVLNVHGNDMNAKRPIIIAFQADQSRAYWAQKMFNRTKFKGFRVVMRRAG